MIKRRGGITFIKVGRLSATIALQTVYVFDCTRVSGYEYRTHSRLIAKVMARMLTRRYGRSFDYGTRDEIQYVFA